MLPVAAQFCIQCIHDTALRLCTGCTDKGGSGMLPLCAASDVARQLPARAPRTGPAAASSPPCQPFSRSFAAVDQLIAWPPFPFRSAASHFCLAALQSTRSPHLATVAMQALTAVKACPQALSLVRASRSRRSSGERGLQPAAVAAAPGTAAYTHPAASHVPVLPVQGCLCSCRPAAAGARVQ